MDEFGQPKWAKIGLLGFSKSGKTYTSISIGAGILKRSKSKHPLHVFDSEGGFMYQRERIKKLTGVYPRGIMAHSFVDLVRFTKECPPGSVCIIDSVTHPWRELLKAKQDTLGRFMGIMSAKDDWNTQFTAWYLASKCHVIICGRAGFIFEEEVDEDGKPKLTTKGTKMKTETELGFEPSLLIEMQRSDRPDGTLAHEAIVKGDRFSVIDGKRYVDPDFESFKGHFDLLDFGAKNGPTVDVTEKTKDTLEPTGDSKIQREKRERSHVLEAIKNEFIKHFGQSAQDKKIKIELLEEVFGTNSWSAIEDNFKTYTVEKLHGGLGELRELIKQRLEGVTE